jgi:PLP dependent protein
MVNADKYKSIAEELRGKATLVAVSKTKPAEDIKELYEIGHRDFGENYVQELTEKQPKLPADIRWHHIGHLQSNKVKYIAPFVFLIHGVDSLKLLKEIGKQAEKNGRTIDCLLQIHIAQEETKFGLDADELQSLLDQFQQLQHPHVRIRGLMGMASFTDDMEKVKAEFHYLKTLFDKYSGLAINNCDFTILSMGMSSDYQLAVREGSTMVRVGSLIFGDRQHS